MSSTKPFYIETRFNKTKHEQQTYGEDDTVKTTLYLIKNGHQLIQITDEWRIPYVIAREI
jgi:hypothetical protein